MIDQTRGLLYHIEENFPGAFHDSVRYICVAGKYEKGAPLLESNKGNESEEKEEIGEILKAQVIDEAEAATTIEQKVTLQQRIIGQGYKVRKKYIRDFVSRYIFLFGFIPF